MRELTSLSPNPHLPAVLRSLRLHHWSKNLLIFVPFSLNLYSASLNDFISFTIAFVLLGVLTSATYLVNDLADLENDRLHPRKSLRPLASGHLPVVFGLVTVPVLLVISLAGAYLLDPTLAAIFGLYLSLTLSYSFRLKQLAIADVLVIATLFTIRILCGMVLLENKPISNWLLIFSAFFFTSLAFMKRDAELTDIRRLGVSRLQGRAYQVEDREFVLTVGIGAGVASLVVFSLFIAETMMSVRQYSSPGLLWIAEALLAYWLLLMWFKTNRGSMSDDPILFALKDAASLGIFALIALTVALAQVI